MKNKTRNTESKIKAGELLLTEQPFVYVLSSKEKGLRCDSCLEKCKVLKCSGCQFVHYCGRACQRDAWNDHKWECSNLKRIAPKVLPDAARVLARIINRLRRGDGNSYRAFYSPNSFRMWKDLMSHYSDLKADKKRMDHFTSLCVVLYEFLTDVSLPNTVELMGIYGRMVINSFNILDIDMNSIGTGIYMGASVIDHSCEPNAVATFVGKTINIRATRDMDCLDWNQVRISYIDLMKAPYERQTELLEGYYFLCECHRCLDECQQNMVYAAKCRNPKCDHPVNIPWKENSQIVRRPNVENGKIDSISDNSNINNHKINITLNDNEDNNKISKEAIVNINGTKTCSSKEKNNELNIDCDRIAIENGDLSNNCEDLSKKSFQSGVLKCEDACGACGTRFTDKDIDIFKETMEFSELHLQNMKGASVAYVDVCKYCLERQQGVLHPLNVLYCQTLDHAFDAYIQTQLWEQACVYAEQLIPCFTFYYGERHPLLGLLHLKYGKMLLYKMDLQKALGQLKCSEKILKITHGQDHPLYKEQLLPLLRQAMIECS